MTASEALFRLFVMREDVYPQQIRSGAYILVQKPLTLDLLRAHVRGEVCVGAYQLKGELCRWICWDADGMNESADNARDSVQMLVRTCRHFGLVPYVEKSGRKGYHVWLFLEECSAAAARSVGLGILQEAGEEILNGCSEIAVFPKQIRVEPGDYGNLVKLPFGKRADNGQVGEFVDADTLEPLPKNAQVILLNGVVPHSNDDLIQIIDENGWDVEEVSESSSRFNRGYSTDLPCYEHISSFDSDARIPKGHRNEVLFAFTNHHKRKGSSQNVALRDILALNRDRCSPPEDERKVRRTVESAYKSVKSSACCKIIQAADLCPAILTGKACPIYEKELDKQDARKASLNADETSLTITPLRVLRTDPPIYTACVLGQDMQLTLDELSNFLLFKKRCLAKLDFIPELPRVEYTDASGRKRSKPAGAVWDEIVNDALASVIEEEPPPEDASPRGVVWNEILSFLTEGRISDVADGGSRDDIKRGAVVLDRVNGVPSYIFRGDDLRRRLRMLQINDLPTGQVWKLIADKGGRNGMLDTPTLNKVRVYMIPASVVAEARGQVEKSQPETQATEARGLYE